MMCLIPTTVSFNKRLKICFVSLLEPIASISDEAQSVILCAEMQTLAVQPQIILGCRDLPSALGLGCYNGSITSFSPENEPAPALSSRIWAVQLAVVSLLSSTLLFRFLPPTRTLAAPPTLLYGKDPPQVPYSMPVVGNLLSYLLDAAKLASSITCVVPFPIHSFYCSSPGLELTACQAKVWGFGCRSP